MNTAVSIPESLAGQAGRIAVVISPRPCSGPLAYMIVTHPAALHVRGLGIDLRPAGAFTKGNQLHCSFETRDLGRALPALMAYFEQVRLAAFCKFGYRLPDPAPGQLQSWCDVDPSRSYCLATAETWRDRLRAAWKNLLTSPRVTRAKCWWFNRQLRGDIAAAFVVLAVSAGLAGLLGAHQGWAAVAVPAIALSGLAFAAAIVTRPLISLDEAERLIARALREGQQERAEFIRTLKGEKRDGDEGGHRE